MAQRRFHYDTAFEHYLRSNGIPYVAVDEAKRAIDGMPSGGDRLKSFDFVVYSDSGPNLLVDVKGRKHSGKTGNALQNWVTAEDVDGLTRWQQLFGKGFVSVFAFMFWCEAQPPDALFHEVFEHGDRWYAVQGVRVEDYRQQMRRRSERWNTVSLPTKVFGEIAQPLVSML